METKHILFTLVFVCGVIKVSTQRFSSFNTTTPPSPYSEGESSLYLEAGELCWCGTNTDCKQLSSNARKKCSCKSGYVGTPPRCRPEPKIWDLCYKDNPCGLNSDCSVENGTRRCSCAWPYQGTTPHCRLRPDAQFCQQKDRCGPNALCNHSNHKCYCEPGFVGSPPNCRPGVALLSRCNPYPCGAHSDCHMQDGAPVCSCLPDFVGEPPNCTPGPEMWRVCFSDNPCRHHSECRMEDRVAVCSPCAEGSSGEVPLCSLD